MPHLLGGAVSVGLARAAGIGPSVPNPDGSRSSANGDFTAQGLANAAGGLLQPLPSGGSLSRTGVAVGRAPAPAGPGSSRASCSPSSCSCAARSPSASHDRHRLPDPRCGPLPAPVLRPGRFAAPG
ncbi:hypothetical protein ACWGK1_07460 [Streptomyces wedmorensis]